MGESIDFPNSTSESSEPVNPKSKLKIKAGLGKEGDITIRGIITRNKLSYLINELHKEKSGSKDLQHRTLTKRAPVYLGKYSFSFCFRF
jgi:hypothetical protein